MRSRLKMPNPLNGYLPLTSSILTIVAVLAFSLSLLAQTPARPGLAAGGRFTIRQGEDMGAPSLIAVEVSGQPGAPVRVGGAARPIL